MDEMFEKINFVQNIEIPLEELSFDFFRSSGPGGQNVNKVSTGVRIRWDIERSDILTEEQKEKIRKKYPKKITKEGNFIMECEETRSQSKNKEIVLGRLNDLINETLKPEKKRKKTRPPKNAIEKRLKAKKEISEKKERRSSINTEEF